MPWHSPIDNAFSVHATELAIVTGFRWNAGLAVVENSRNHERGLTPGTWQHDDEQQTMTTAASHVVLLGDSIFDNASYTQGEPDVVTHLRAVLPVGARATLLAVNGSITRSMTQQVSRIPTTATHLVVSIGGNDARGNADLLEAPVRSTTDALRRFDERLASFEANYRAAVQPVLGLGLPTTLCTIYNGAFEDADEARRVRVALMMFNDVILRVAFERHASVIDLRLVCKERTDYANPIEPSGSGGLKIARVIAAMVGRPAGNDPSAVFC